MAVGARLVDASRLYRCEIHSRLTESRIQESYCQFNAKLKKWANEMCFVIVASNWMIRVYGLAI